MYNAVNKGLRLARGEILAYLNTDDRYFSYSVETAVEALKNPTISYVYGDMLNFDESKAEGTIVFYPPATTSYLLCGGLIGQPTVFWKRSVTDEVGGFDETLVLAADHEYWRRIGLQYRGARVDEVLAYEEEHPHRLTAGEKGRSQGLGELEAVRRRYAGDREPTVLDNLREKARLAFWHRLLTLRFLWRRRRPLTRPGKGWSGFLAVQDTFAVNVNAMLLGLIPVVGRRFKRSVVRR